MLRLYIIQEEGAVAIGDLPRVQQGAKEVSSGGDSYFMPSRPGQFPVIWGLAVSLGPREYQGDSWADGMVKAGSTARDGEWGSAGRDCSVVKCWCMAGDSSERAKGAMGLKLLT